jgi:two-component system OmpR family response regulator
VQRKPLVLVVDDDPTLRKLIRAHLSRLDLDSIEAAEGHDGLACLDREEIDLVCLDLMLPTKSGFAICEAIRRSSRATVPVLILSARGTPEDRARAEEAGANGYLVKPFRRAEFDAHVRRLLQLPEIRS